MYANILMPVLGNIGNMLYVVVAVVGTLFFIYDIPNFSGMSGLSPFSIAVILVKREFLVKSIGDISKSVISCRLCSITRFFILSSNLSDVASVVLLVSASSTI